MSDPFPARGLGRGGTTDWLGALWDTELGTGSYLVNTPDKGLKPRLD